MRLDKFVCKSTQLKRHAAIGKIEQGAVRVNDHAVRDPSFQVHENNQITLDGAELVPRPSRYLMLHKPIGTVCSNVDEAYPSVFNALDIPDHDNLHIAGRLDADSSGLVLATDDGRWSFNIIRPNQTCPKTYLVELRDPISEDTAERFEAGILLQGETAATLPASLEAVSEKQARLTITEGRYHQVKRMFAAVGNRVETLHRERIGEITLDMPEGQWRELSPAEASAWLSE